MERSPAGLEQVPLTIRSGANTHRFVVDEPTTPVVVSIWYLVEADNHADSSAPCSPCAASDSAPAPARWQNYRVGEDPRIFVEQFEVASWQERERQHHGRLTADDKAIEDATFTEIIGRPHPGHLLPATAEPRRSRNRRPA